WNGAKPIPTLCRNARTASASFKPCSAILAERMGTRDEAHPCWYRLSLQAALQKHRTGDRAFPCEMQPAISGFCMSQDEGTGLGQFPGKIRRGDRDPVRRQVEDLFQAGTDCVFLFACASAIGRHDLHGAVADQRHGILALFEAIAQNNVHARVLQAGCREARAADGYHEALIGEDDSDRPVGSEGDSERADAVELEQAWDELAGRLGIELGVAGGGEDAVHVDAALQYFLQSVRFACEHL